MSDQQFVWLSELSRSPDLGIGPRTAVKRCLEELDSLRKLVEAKNEALRKLADSSKYRLFGVDCPGGAHIGWMAYGRPDKIAKAALDKE